MKYLRNSVSGLAGFLAPTLLLVQPALAAYCYSPVRGPYISAETYCRAWEGIQITQQQYKERSERWKREQNEPKYCVRFLGGEGVQPFISNTSECPPGTHIIPKYQYDELRRAEGLR
jgi:hypothetical protein